MYDAYIDVLIWVTVLAGTTGVSIGVGTLYLALRHETGRINACVRRQLMQHDKLAGERIDGLRRTIERHDAACGGRVQAGRETWEPLAVDMSRRLERLEAQAHASPLERASYWITLSATDETFKHLLELRALERAGKVREQ